MRDLLAPSAMRTVYFTLAHEPTRQQKVGDVGTTDEEKHDGSSHQDPQCVFRVSQHPVAKKSHAQDVVPIGCGKLMAEIGADGSKILLSVV